MNKYLDNGLYSQNGEYGIIREILKRIGLTQGHAIEFGAADGFFCSNTADISNEFQFTRNLYDISPSGKVAYKEITPENVNEIGPCDLLSIDIDGNDYEVWKAYKGKPAVVVIEINSSLDPEKDFFSPEQGCNFSMMLKLGIEKGYRPICHTGNMIFVDEKYWRKFPELKDVMWNELFNKAWLQAQQ
jgi:hypothetical protein